MSSHATAAPPAASPEPARRRAHTRGITWFRFWLGARWLDAMFGVHGNAALHEALTANTPSLEPESVEEGWQLASARAQRYPAGVPARRVGAALWIAGAVVAVATGALLVLSLLAALLSVVAGWFGRAPLGPAALDQVIGPWLLIPGTITLLATMVLAGLAALADEYGHVQEARFAVRWAAQRPGQAARGIPDSSPFGRLRTLVLVAAVLTWAFALAALVGWAVTGVDEGWTLTEALGAGTVLTAVLLLLAGGLSVAVVRCSAAHELAGRHLFLLDDPPRGTRADAATAVAHRFLLVTTGEALREWVIYPHTVRLSAAPLALRRRRLEQDPRTTVLSGGGGAPLALVRVVEPLDPDSLSAYLGGSVVATALLGTAVTAGHDRRVYLCQPRSCRLPFSRARVEQAMALPFDLDAVVEFDEPGRLPQTTEALLEWIREVHDSR